VICTFLWVGTQSVALPGFDRHRVHVLLRQSCSGRSTFEWAFPSCRFRPAACGGSQLQCPSTVGWLASLGTALPGVRCPCAVVRNSLSFWGGALITASHGIARSDRPLGSRRTDANALAAPLEFIIMRETLLFMRSTLNNLKFKTLLEFLWSSIWEMRAVGGACEKGL